MSDKELDLTFLAIASKIQSRFQLIFRTTLAVWTDSGQLLSGNTNSDGKASSTAAAPKEYFLLMLGLSAALESLLFPPLPSFELPSLLNFVGRLIKFFPELTVLLSTFTVLLSTVGPWVASRLTQKPIPFKILARAYSYQHGAFTMPATMLINVIVFGFLRLESDQVESGDSHWANFLIQAACWVWRSASDGEALF